MSAAPRLYARFAPLFARMDLPLRSALEGMLASFAMVPALTPEDDRQINGEFVGFDGIENRGKLSNLLESEWLLRELDPDDFVRRIAEGEVMFRRRDFKGTGAKDVLCAVLDCGPWMLGNNRVIALASLFHLALRADRIGARLLWTVPGVAKGWSEDLTADNIRIFLGRIVQGAITPAVIDAALEDFESEPKECWYVGAAQSENLTQHPGITGSIIIQNRYDVGDVAVRVNSRGRKTTLSIRPTKDDETVAALRRPFMPERMKKTKVANDKGNLTAQPFHKHWLLDRFNHAVLIRFPEGVLWYPFQQERAPTWIPTPKGKTLLGVQPQAKGKLSVLLGRRDAEAELFSIDVSQNLAKVISQKSGYFLTKIGPQPSYAMGNLFLLSDNQCLFVTEDGTARIVVTDGTSTPNEKDDRVILSDGIYMIEQTNNVLRVRNLKRGTLARVTLPPDHQDLFQHPRRTVFTPDTKAITFTTDGVWHTALIGLDLTRFELKGMVLLHLHSTSRALAWDAAENSLVRFQLIDSEVSNVKRTAIETPISGVPRYCPLTQTIFAMNIDNTGMPQSFVPVETTRGWQYAEAFDIPETIEKAQTLWL